MAARRSLPVLELAGLLAALTGTGPVHAASDVMATGTAVYEIEVDPVADGPAPAGAVSGDMTVSLALDCKAYRTDVAFRMSVGSTEFPMVKMDMASTLVEEGDRLAFAVDGKINGKTFDAAAGTAERTDAGLKVAITAPEAKAFDIAGPVLFPIGLIDAAVAAARAGKSFGEFRLFDGSERGEGVHTVSVLIAPVPDDADLGEEALFAAGLGFEGLDRWRMTFSYFPPGQGGDQTPAVTSSAIVYENGFSLAAGYEISGIVLRLRLVEFRPVAPKPCA